MTFKELIMPLLALKTHLIDTILPAWLKLAFDDDACQFVEALALDGSRTGSTVVRTRTSARQIYVFAHAYCQNAAPREALDKAQIAFDSLRSTCWMPGERSGFVRSFDRKASRVVDPEIDLYDQSCVLLALAWLFKATGNNLYKSVADETLSAIDKTLAADFGGWAETASGNLPRRQNPHMHFFEACLALWETDGSYRYIARAHDIFALFQTQFYDRKFGLLREFFGPAWEISKEYGSDRIEPGHMAEWVWLIRRYEKLAKEDHTQLCSNLLAASQRCLSEATIPFILDEFFDDGRISKNTRRLWPQTELLKAYITEYAAQNDPVNLKNARELATQIMTEYLSHAPYGMWRDCFDSSGNLVANSIPASSLYHLWTVVADLDLEGMEIERTDNGSIVKKTLAMPRAASM
ncbi:AGE family epimerase/isomerase (plasmid) [Rhizobium sp. CB3090]|uniref:AGE family epimerase/isomerase n=1 Tax=Rhizobium sp. CB3090 TaxID=3039156 RepID=UPI0024B20E02|nr:AGE family epimerase/isomerase [Rhizobium sp. CB3090]WFU12375.1 AGE family epimerase/isomerase [Rhizobium sp. CB3090]